MYKRVFHIVFLASMLGPVSLNDFDFFPPGPGEIPFSPPAVDPASMYDGAPIPTDDKPMNASCEKIFSLVSNWRSPYGRFVVGPVGDEMRVIFTDDMTYLSGKVADQNNHSVLVLNAVGELKKLKEHENYILTNQMLDREMRSKQWSPWLHFDSDGKYFSLCANRANKGDLTEKNSQLGLVWNLQTDEFVRQCNCKFDMDSVKQSIVNDNHPGSAFIIDGGGARRSIRKARYCKGNSKFVEKFVDTCIIIGGFEFSYERYELCVGSSPVTVVSSKNQDPANPWDFPDHSCASNQKEYLGKYGGFVFNNKIYLFGMQNVHILEDDVFRRATNNSAVKQVAYQDFFKCTGEAHQRSAGSGVSTTSWIIIGVLVAIVIAVLILCCVFRVQRKKKTANSSGERESSKPKSNQSNRSLRLKSGSSKKFKSRKSSKNAKSNSQKGSKNAKPSSRKSLKKLNRSSRKSHKK